MTNDLIELCDDVPAGPAPSVDPRAEFIAGLYELADWFYSHAECPIPCQCQVDIFAHSKEQFLEMRRQAGCTEKATVGDWMIFRKKFSGGVRIDINISKENTCRRIKIGERTVEAKPARTVELPAEPEHVEEIYEWRCPEAILSAEELRAAEVEAG